MLALINNLGIDVAQGSVINYFYCPEHVPLMAENQNAENQNEVLIKFLVPQRLKRALQERATERNVSISALMRLISSEYVKRTE